VFIPHVIHGHGKPWWNDIDRGGLLIHPTALWESYQRGHLVAQREELAKEIMNLALRNISYCKGFFNIP
jgi:hypothetical protein